MSKTLKDLFEVYRPKAKDEADFVDKHVTIKHKDRNGNGDDVFNGNTKTIKRKGERKGYDAGDDEKVYEEVKDRIIDALARAAEELGEDFDLETLDAIAEEVMLDELSKGTITNYANKAFDQSNSIIKSRNLDLPKSVKKSAEDAKERRRKGIVSSGKRLGADEMKKISKASADRIVYNKEEVELDELSKGTMGRYINKAATKIGTQGVTAGLKIAKDERSQKNFDTIGKRERGIARAVNKLTREEVEDLDELSVNTLDKYRSKARKEIIDADANDDNRTYNKRAKGYRAASRQVQKKLTKEDIINNVINTYIPEDIELPSNEERLVENLDAQNVSEQHIHILLSMFEGLNEQNQNRMLETSKHIDGVNSLLDFAITNRGE